MMERQLARTLSASGNAVFCRQPDGTFVALNELPDSLGKLLAAQGGTDFSGLPFLENFLFDAEQFWMSATGGRLSSGPWIETSGDQEDIALEASALLVDGDMILLLEDLGSKYLDNVALLQKGRDNLLFNERLESEVRKRTAQIAEREEQIALKLLAAVGYRDEETGMHVKRIGLYSAVMAERLGWSETDIHSIRMAAPMHDIGKIGIPDAILQKPGRLTEPEFEIMKRHPLFGGDMLANTGIGMMDMASEIALCHHERWDGSGYPAGLEGEHIPLAARIVAIVDIYDALTHKRYYKPAFAEDKTLEIMTGMAGNHIDPRLFGLFLEVLPQMRVINESMPDDEPLDEIDLRR